MLFMIWSTGKHNNNQMEKNSRMGDYMMKEIMLLESKTNQ